jgi:hypothetical protein
MIPIIPNIYVVGKDRHAKIQHHDVVDVVNESSWVVVSPVLFSFSFYIVVVGQVDDDGTVEELCDG